jgi:hypothetical protein
MSLGKDGKPGDNDAEEEKAARLMAYRLVRRMEPEVPPLTPKPMEAPVREISQDIIDRNMSQQAIERFKPDAARKRRADWKEVHDGRMRCATVQKEAIVDGRKETYAEMEKARAKEMEQLAHEKQMQFAQKWITTMVVTAFLRTSQQELAMRRMPTSDMLKYVGENEARLKRRGTMSAFVQDAVRLSSTLRDPIVQSRFDMFAKICRYKKKVAEKRNQSQVLFASLFAWRNAGRAIITFLYYLQGVRRVQRWWRLTRRRLHEHRDHVMRRWCKLEREKLHVEANKIASSHFRGHGRKVTMPSMVDDVRKKFVENELRARRYLLLPQLDLWIADQRAWRKEVQEWNETNEAYRLLDKSRTRLPLFRWPPARPSYLPPHHTTNCDASCGKSCPDWCPGRKGDAEIMEMFERARKDPTDWTKIPVRTKGGDDRQPSMRMSARDPMDVALKITDGPSAGMFGPPPSTADMNKYGVTADFPGYKTSSMQRSLSTDELSPTNTNTWTF